MPVTQFASQRVVQGTTATLIGPFVDQDGEPRTPGTVTVGVTASDGTVVRASGTVTVADGDGNPTVALTAAQTAQLDLLTCTWTEAGGAVLTTIVEVIGGRYFTIVEARGSDKALQDTVKFPDDDIKRVRSEVELEVERITGRSFRPRYRIDMTDASGVRSTYSSATDFPLHLSQIDVRTVRSVMINGVAYAQQYWELTESGQIFFGRGVGLLPEQIANGPWRGNLPILVQVGYEYGWPSPPADLKRAMITRLRARMLKDNNSGVADQATQASDNGTTYTLNTSGPTPIPEVNNVYASYTRQDWKSDFAGSIRIA